MKKITISTCIMVSNHYDNSADLAFEDASNMGESIEAEVCKFLYDEIGELAYRYEVRAQFLEFDSGNYTHAGAHYAVTVTGDYFPRDLLDKIAARYAVSDSAKDILVENMP